MEEIHREDDGELCGYVAEFDGSWHALTLFGAVLGEHNDRARAVVQVLAEGLACLAERWILRNGQTGEEEIALIREARPGEVTVSLGYYALAGTPSLTITGAELAAGDWQLIRR